MQSAAVAFLHFAAVFGVFGTLLGEWLLFSRTPTLADARRLQWLDRLYGISAVVLLLAGGLRAYRFEKGLDYYLANPFFHIKLTLFIVIGVMSIYPTIVFIRWGRATRAGRAPTVSEPEWRWVRRLLVVELLLVFAVAACASLMAKGIGA